MAACPTHDAPLPVVVTYEDRPEAFAGVELLARSLAREAPGVKLEIHSPSPEAADRLADLPHVLWQPADDLAAEGWDVKPTVLLRALDRHERVLWLDTDIVVSGDLAATLARFDPDAVVVGEDFPETGTEGGDWRARGHGLVPTRRLDWPVNSGSLVVSRAHRPLVQAWQELLASAPYREAQKIPRESRPAPFYGDQDVLWALLVSQDFAALKVDAFRTGRDLILHCGMNGFSVADRLRVLKGARPALVHMLGPYKPWSFATSPPISCPNAYLHFLCYELSPFLTAGQTYGASIGDPPWLNRRSAPGRFLNALFLGNPALSGLPFATVAALRLDLKRRMSRLKRRCLPA